MSKFEQLTPRLNQDNIDSVRYMIDRKKMSIPFYATEANSMGVTTDFDTFPYPRYFRGVYSSPTPVVMEREAGFRPRHDKCYDIEVPNYRQSSKYPNHCFETACSTTYPCYPQYLTKYSDRDALNLQLNKACIVQYR